MMAAGNGSVGIVRMLIQHGANMNLTNKVTGPRVTVHCYPDSTVSNMYIQGGLHV